MKKVKHVSMKRNSPLYLKEHIYIPFYTSLNIYVFVKLSGLMKKKKIVTINCHVDIDMENNEMPILPFFQYICSSCDLRFIQ